MVASLFHQSIIGPSRTDDVNNLRSRRVQHTGRNGKPPDVMKIQVRSILAGGLILSMAWAAGCTSKNKEPRVYHHSPTPPGPPADLTKFEPSTPTPTPTPPPAPAPVAVEEAIPEPPPAEAPPAPAPVVNAETTEIAPDVAGVIEMAKRGVGGEALLAYVEANPIVTKLDPETIVYLNDLGVPENVVAAMIRKADADQPQPAPAENQATQGAPVASTPAPPAQTQPAPPPSAPPADDNYFHRSLAPYGDWIYDGRHGWVWRPTVAAVDTGWRPYCHGGRWIYSDVGWYWHSTYSWGWAPFHYGRWHRSSIHGWYWVPGYRWSPAWVHWRSSNIYCGWAPLPPGCDYVTGVGYMWHGSRVSVGFHFGLSHHHYTYCDYAYLRHRRLHRHRVRDNDVTIVHNETKVVNNHITENNTTIINNGVPPELVEKKTREPVRKVRIREVDLELESIARVGQIDENGKTLAVYRPTVPTPPDSTPSEKPANRQQVSKTATPDTTEGQKTNSTDNNTDDDKDNGRRIAKQRGDSQLEKPGNTKISGSKGILTPRPFARSGGSSGRPSAGNGTSPSRSTSTAASTPSKPSRLGSTGRSPTRAASSKPLIGRSSTLRRTPANSSARAAKPPVPVKPSSIGRSPGFKRYTPKITVRKPVRAYGTAGANQPAAPSRPGGRISSTRPSTPGYSAPSTPRRPVTPGRSISRNSQPSSPSYRAPSRSVPRMYNPSSRPSGRSVQAPSRSYSPPSRSLSQPSRSYSPPSRSISPPSRSYSPPARSSAPSRSYSPPSRSISRPSAPSRSSSPPSSSPPSSSSGPPQRDPL